MTFWPAEGSEGQLEALKGFEALEPGDFTGFLKLLRSPSSQRLQARCSAFLNTMEAYHVRLSYIYATLWFIVCLFFVLQFYPYCSFAAWCHWIDFCCCVGPRCGKTVRPGSGVLSEHHSSLQQWVPLLSVNCISTYLLPGNSLCGKSRWRPHSRVFTWFVCVL